MNNLMQGKEDKEPTQKRQNVFWGIYLKANWYKRCVWGIYFKTNCYKRFLQKGWCVIEKVPWKDGSFDCEKQFANLVCGECVV
jgi:hypothetical protein